MNNDNRKVTLLVSSCDIDEDTWLPYFVMLNKNWKDKPVEWPIVLNTEAKKFSYTGYDICCANMKKNAHKISWSRRLYKVVKNIDTPLVLLTLSDYFLIDSVDQCRVDKCVDWMLKNPNIGYVSFYPNDSCVKIEDSIQGDFIQCQKGSSFVVNAQMGMWNRETLLKLLKLRCSAWEWELDASEYTLFLNYDYYTLRDDVSLIFPYDWRADGYSVYSRKWTRRCKEMFEENGIDIDLSVRGVWNLEEGHPAVRKRSRIKQLFRPPFIRRCVRRITKR